MTSFEELMEVVVCIQSVVGDDRCRNCILKSKNAIAPTLKFLFNLICEVYADNCVSEIWTKNRCQHCNVSR